MARWHRSHESVFVSGATDDRSLRGPAQRYRLELVHQCRRVHAAIHHEPGFIRGLGHKFSPAGHHLWPEHRDQSRLRSAAVLPAGPLMKGADKAMKTRIQKLVVGAALVGAATLVQAQFNYNNNGNGTCTITGYTDPGGAVTIPNSIAGLTVVGIGSGAFYGNSFLTNVTIGSSVTGIGDGAFSYCISLTSVTIPDSVTSIGYGAFDYCSSLTAITVDAANSFYTSANG